MSFLQSLGRTWPGHAWISGFWPQDLERTCLWGCLPAAADTNDETSLSPLFCQWSSPFPNLSLPLYPDYSLAHPTCMGADVALEQPGSGEGLATHLADAGQRVGADVHLEGTQAGILLVAVPAGEGGPSRQGAVQLLVPGQACQRMIGPVTVDALETAWGSRGSLGP